MTDARLGRHSLKALTRPHPDARLAGMAIKALIRNDHPTTLPTTLHPALSFAAQTTLTTPVTATPRFATPTSSNLAAPVTLGFAATSVRTQTAALLISDSTTANPVALTHAALAGNGVASEMIAPTGAADLDTAWGSGDAYDLIVVVRYSAADDAATDEVIAWLAEKWAAGVPVLLGGPNDQTVFANTPDENSIAERFGIISSPYLYPAQGGYDTTVTDIVSHPITDGVVSASTCAIWYDQHVQVLEVSQITPAGTTLAKRAGNAIFTAVESGDPIIETARNASAATAPTRAVWCGWLNPDDYDHTEYARRYLGRAVGWLIGAPAPTQPVYTGVLESAYSLSPTTAVGLGWGYVAEAVAMTRPGDLALAALSYSWKNTEATFTPPDGWDLVSHVETPFQDGSSTYHGVLEVYRHTMQPQPVESEYWTWRITAGTAVLTYLEVVAYRGLDVIGSATASGATSQLGTGPIAVPVDVSAGTVVQFAYIANTVFDVDPGIVWSAERGRLFMDNTAFTPDDTGRTVRMLAAAETAVGEVGFGSYQPPPLGNTLTPTWVDTALLLGVPSFAPLDLGLNVTLGFDVERLPTQLTATTSVDLGFVASNTEIPHTGLTLPLTAGLGLDTPAVVATGLHARLGFAATAEGPTVLSSALTTRLGLTATAVTSTSFDLTLKAALGLTMPPFKMAGTSQRVFLGPPGGFPNLPEVMQITALVDGPLDNAPTTVPVAVGSAPANTTIDFSIDAGPTVFSWPSTETGRLGPVEIPVAAGYLAGDHTITALAPGALAATCTFTLAGDTPALPATPGPDTPPTPTPDYRWRLEDPMLGGLGLWTFTANPASANPMPNIRTLNLHHTTLADGRGGQGRYHVFESRPLPQQWSFAGVLWRKEDYETLRAYAALNRRLWLVDHRGRAWVITFVSLDLVPRKRVVGPAGGLTDWVIDYTATVVVYDQHWTPVNTPNQPEPQP